MYQPPYIPSNPNAHNICIGSTFFSSQQPEIITFAHMSMSLQVMNFSADQTYFVFGQSHILARKEKTIAKTKKEKKSHKKLTTRKAVKIDDNFKFIFCLSYLRPRFHLLAFFNVNLFFGRKIIDINHPEETAPRFCPLLPSFLFAFSNSFASCCFTKQQPNKINSSIELKNVSKCARKATFNLK